MRSSGILLAVLAVLAVLVLALVGVGLWRLDSRMESAAGLEVHPSNGSPDAPGPTELVPGEGARTPAEGQAVQALSQLSPSDPEYFERNLAGLHGGTLKREDVGPEYDSLITRIAQKHAFNNLHVGMRTRAATFCGFKNWNVLSEMLDSQDPLHQAAQPILARLADEAVTVAADVEAWAEAAWSLPNRLEEFDPSVEHSTADWVAINYPADRDALLTFVTTTRAGDRVFQLHFFSSDFPQLEARLQNLKALKDEYWEVVKGDRR